MSRAICEKIIEPARHTESRRGIAALALVILCSSIYSVSASPAFDRSTFNKIQFSNSCRQKQWVLLPDNSLELLMAPAGSEPCEATLDFFFPQDAAAQSVLQFETRGTRSG